MKVLLVNDDGYRAKGINVLEDVLAKAGHDVYVTAPTTEQSAKSHSMTIDGRRYATEYKRGHYRIDGTPADCIIYGLKSGLVNIKPDVVISGINHGYNLSTDIIYSGTCGAARQAAFYGYKAIAISAEYTPTEDYRFEDCAAFLCDHLEKFLPMIEKNVFMNINIPVSFAGECAYASIGEIKYDDRFSIEKEGNRYRISNIGCDISFNTLPSALPHDFEICKLGLAAISLVELYPSCYFANIEKGI